MDASENFFNTWYSSICTARYIYYYYRLNLMPEKGQQQVVLFSYHYIELQQPIIPYLSADFKRSKYISYLGHGQF